MANRRRRVAAALVALLVVAGALGYYWYFLRRPPVGRGPAGPEVPLEPFTTTWTERPVVLLGLGDSITAGYGASEGKSYFQRLVRNPPDEWDGMKGRSLSRVLPGLETRMVAVSGSTSLDCVERQLPELQPYPPETLGLAVITTGGNDIIHMYGRVPPREGAMYGASMEQARPWVANYRKRLDTIVERVEKLFPGGCYIFLGNIYDPSDGVGDPSVAGLPPWDDVLEVLRAYNEAIAGAAAKHDSVRLVDIHGAFLGHGFHCTQPWNEHYRPEDPHHWYFSNVEDPNDRGYDAIRRLFLLVIADAAEDIRAGFEGTAATGPAGSAASVAGHSQ